MIYNGNCLEIMKTIPTATIDSIITDPPYAEIKRSYGRYTENQWHEMMDSVVMESRRILKPTGSAVFILQPNSESIGRMRPWIWEFMAKWSKEWNMIQDAWWWNPCAMPTVHCWQSNGLMRPSVKACVWLGSPDCYKDQSSVLWDAAEATVAKRSSSRILRKRPSGQSVRDGRACSVSEERGGVTPFNLLPIPNNESKYSSGALGHPAGTPLALLSWWCKYITPSCGTVLDPFFGCGTTGIAALQGGFQFIGIEIDSKYVEKARTRIDKHFESQKISFRKGS